MKPRFKIVIFIIITLSIAAYIFNMVRANERFKLPIDKISKISVYKGPYDIIEDYKIDNSTLQRISNEIINSKKTNTSSYIPNQYYNENKAYILKFYYPGYQLLIYQRDQESVTVLSCPQDRMGSIKYRIVYSTYLVKYLNDLESKNK